MMDPTVPLQKGIGAAGSLPTAADTEKPSLQLHGCASVFTLGTGSCAVSCGTIYVL